MKSRNSHKNHFVKRANERLDLIIQLPDVEELNFEINHHQHELIAWKERSKRGIYKIKKWNKEFNIIYDYDLNVPVTVLSEDMKIYELYGFNAHEVDLAGLL